MHARKVILSLLHILHDPGAKGSFLDVCLEFCSFRLYTTAAERLQTSPTGNQLQFCTRVRPGLPGVVPRQCWLLDPSTPDITQVLCLVQAEASARLPRFYIQADLSAVTGSRIELSTAESKHATRVLRLGNEALVEVCNGRGQVVSGRLITQSKAAAHVLTTTQMQQVHHGRQLYTNGMHRPQQ